MKKFVVALTCIFLIMIVSITAMASDEEGSVDSVKYIVRASGDIEEICRRMDDEGYEGILNYNSSTGMVSFSNREYHKLSTSDKSAFMERVLKLISESGMNVQNKNKLYNFIEDQDGTVASAIKFLSSDTSADFVTASKWLKPFSGPIGTFLGVVALLTFLFMGASIVIDCAYLVIPFVAETLNRDDPHKRPLFVSVEAWKSLEEAEMDPGYRSPMGLYLKRKAKMMVVVSICLMYLVSGQIYDLMAWFVDAFGNMFSF